MKDLIENLAVETVKDTFFTGGNICVDKTGTYLFCICNTNVNIIDKKTGKVFKTIETDEDEITCITLSPNNKHLITSHRNILLKQWDWSQSLCIRTWKATHIAPIQSMNIDSTSSLLATGSSDFTCKIWDLNAQYCTHNLKGAQGILRVVKFHPEILTELKIFTGSEDSKIRVYDLKTSTMTACLEGHFSAITCLEFVNDNTFLLSSSRDNVVIVWNLSQFQSIRTIPIYESIESIVILPQKFTSYFKNIDFNSNDCFLTFGNDGLIKIWNWKNAKLVYKQSGEESLKIENTREKDSDLQQVIVNAFYHEGLDSVVLTTIDKLIAFVQFDCERVFSIEKQLIGHHGEVLDIAICSKDGSLIAVATNSELIKIYNTNNWNCQLLKGHSDIVICLNSYYKSKASYLLSSSKDSTIRLWKQENEESQIFKEVAIARGHTQDVGSICFSKLDFKFFVSASIDTTIKLWNINNTSETSYELKVLFTQKAHDKDINSVCVAPNDKYIASGSSDKVAKLWDATSGECLGVFKGHKRGIWCVLFSPIDQVIATSSADSTIKLWSISDFSCVKTFEAHNTSVLKIIFITNGTQLVSSASDGLLKIWNIKTNECLNTYDEHADKIWALCADPFETKFLTGGADSKLILWKNITSEMHVQEMEKREDILLKEQELMNCLKEKKYKKALKLSIILDRPFKCYEIINEILLNKDCDGRNDLKEIIVKLREDHLQTLLKYSIDWNTNSKYCHNAQALIQVILNNFPMEDLMKLNNFSNMVEQFLPYSDRHFSRINKLMQQIMFVDFTWNNMKLDDNREKINTIVNEK